MYYILRCLATKMPYIVQSLLNCTLEVIVGLSGKSNYAADRKNRIMSSDRLLCHKLDPGSHCTVLGEHIPDGLQDELDIQAETPVLDIFRIQPDDLFEVRDVAAAAGLPHAGDAGAEGQPCPMVILVLLPLVHRGRAGADNAHISLQHVPELRKLVQGVRADKLADSGLPGSIEEDLVPDDARIEFQLEHHAVGDAVLGHKFLLPRVRVHVHRADLIDLEALAVLADTLLLIDDGTGGLSPDDRSDDQHDEQGEHAADETADDVHHALEEKLHR